MRTNLFMQSSQQPRLEFCGGGGVKRLHNSILAAEMPNEDALVPAIKTANFSPKSNYLWLLVVMIAITLAAMFIAPIHSTAKAATIYDAPNAAVPKDTDTVPARNSFIAKFNGSGKTQFSTFGGSTVAPEIYVPSLWTSDKHENDAGFDLTKVSKGKVGWKYTNIGFDDQGRSLDMTITLMDFEYVDPNTQIVAPWVGMTKNGLGVNYTTGVTKIKLALTTVLHGTDVKVKTSGFMTFNDIDLQQGVTLPTDLLANVSKIYIPESTDPFHNNKVDNFLNYKKEADGSETFTSPDTGNAGANGNDLYAMLTMLYNNLDTVNIQYNPAKVYPADRTHGWGVVSGFGYTALKPLATETTVPNKKVSLNATVDGTDSVTLLTQDQEHYFTVIHNVPGEIARFYKKSYVLTDPLPKGEMVDKVAVTLGDGKTDVSDRFTITKDNGKVVLTATPDALKNADFYNQDYKIKISTHLTTPNTTGTTETLTNVASVTIDGTTKSTDPVKVIVPPLVTAKATKQVSTDDKTWSTHAGIEYGKDYFYKGTVTVPNDKDYNTVAVRENFDNLQAYKDVKVTDASGDDVSTQGVLTTTKSGNLTRIVWTANKPADWSGKQITISLTANLGDLTGSQKDANYNTTTNRVEIKNTIDLLLNNVPTPSPETSVTPTPVKQTVSKYLEK